MPYITPERRQEVVTIFASGNNEALTEGDLNYAITSIVDAWLGDLSLSYAKLNSAIGVLECAKLELYRRVVVQYEDKKRTENGDVYTKR